MKAKSSDPGSTEPVDLRRSERRKHFPFLMERQSFALTEGQEDDDAATVVRYNGVSDVLENTWENLGDSDEVLSSGSAPVFPSAPAPSSGYVSFSAPAIIIDVPVPVSDHAPCPVSVPVLDSATDAPAPAPALGPAPAPEIPIVVLDPPSGPGLSIVPESDDAAFNRDFFVLSLEVWMSSESQINVHDLI